MLPQTEAVTLSIGSMIGKFNYINIYSNHDLNLIGTDDIFIDADDELHLACVDLGFFNRTTCATKQTVANVPAITTTGAWAEWHILVEADLNALRTNLLALETALKAYNLIT